MTYRYVPQKWLRLIQIATLFFTAVLGLSVVALPPTSAQLSKLEETMNGDWFGWVLFAVGMTGTAAALLQHWGKHERYVPMVAWCHIIACGALAGFFTASLWGVLVNNWRVFGTPTLVLLLFIWHLAFIQRRPRDKLPPPALTVDLYDGTSRIERLLKEHDL